MNQRDSFIEISSIDSVIHAANNGIIAAEGIGTMRIMIKDTKGKAIEMNIYRVLYIL